ncbi:type VI secretion system baseplate subunit TssF [Pseudomonas sp. RGM2987]|uniref:type VI secretion system baseplate subunit TssF n=1 Tax=Pseudomonas sp. RGM2987 TaxID=2930090 RepID=UPI001FD6FC59|nr:type VI secretion system baseplate subunit TssF [Pseudomonas sp. RGM2987]MCJ8205750.1 type VI secretion system baseplate subunit TssF [Pseudomonas sp. RGM2987]
MSFNHYYQSELTALRQLGVRFAERNPALAPFLGQAGQDPDVERLLEGFAFLTGRLRQKLDDQLPELSHSLMQLLWPNYMRPLPAFGMLQFDPLRRPGPALRVERDTPVQSKPVEEVCCRFLTCYPTDVLALELTGLNYSVKGEGSLLNLRLEMCCDGHFGELKMSRLRLHFAGERYISQMLYLSLLRNLERIELVALDGAGAALKAADGSPVTFRMAPDSVQPVGFAEEEALLPYPLNTFRGYRYLQEYFAFQDKFLFVDVIGLDVINTLQADSFKQMRGLDLRFDIGRSALQRMRPTLENVKLYCTPIVNLFKHDAQPIRLDGKQDEYPLLPADYEQKHCAVFSVESVTGWKPGGLGYQAYVPFESFEHDASFDVSQDRPYYSVRHRPSSLYGGLDTRLGFGAQHVRPHETLSIELMCTNRDLSCRLKPGDIDQPGDKTPDSLSFRNIGRVTPSFAPPLDHGFLWKLISNMSLNYLSLANVNALKVILKTYDFARYYDEQAEKVSKRLLDGLKSIRHQPVDRLHRGLPVRGLRTELTIDPQGYIGEGDLFIFASVLNEFFALYASLNSYHELRVTSTQGEVYQWAPRMGQQPLL